MTTHKIVLYTVNFIQQATILNEIYSIHIGGEAGQQVRGQSG